MRENLRGTVWRLAVFVTVCLFGIFTMIAVFGQFRFDDRDSYSAVFSSASGLKADQMVRIGGVEVGKVRGVRVQPDTSVRVDFDVERSVHLTTGSRAVIRYENLVGDRYLSLEQGEPGTNLQPGQTISAEQTAPALDLDALVGGFRPLFRALNPEQVNRLTGELIQAFQGQGEALSSLLAHVGSFSTALADRDALIGDVISNLDAVMTSVGDQSGQLDVAVDNLSALIDGLAQRRTALADGVGQLDAAAASVAGLLQEARPPLRATVNQLDRVASQAVADHEYLDNLLATLPDRYRVLARQGIYGNYFSFYLCDVLLKLNGKGGQPVYVKMAGQTTGRCALK
ncbi:MCE family protein [Mycolicibacterium sp. XJ1819]